MYHRATTDMLGTEQSWIKLALFTIYTTGSDYAMCLSPCPLPSPQSTHVDPSFLRIPLDSKIPFAPCRPPSLRASSQCPRRQQALVGSFMGTVGWVVQPASPDQSTVWRTLTDVRRTCPSSRSPGASSQTNDEAERSSETAGIQRAFLLDVIPYSLEVAEYI